MFGTVLRVIGSKSDAKWFRTVFGQTPWTPSPLWILAKTFCIGKRSREMMFGVVLAKTFCIGKRIREMIFGVVLIVIGSKSDAKWFKTVFGQKPWTPPLWILVKISNWLKLSV